MGRTTFKGPVVSVNGFEGLLEVADPLLAEGLTVGEGTQITYIEKGTVAVNPASLDDGDSADTSVTITGAAAGDTVIMNPPTAGLDAGIYFVGAWVSAADTVKVRLANHSGGTVDVASASWAYTLIKS